MYVHFSVDVLLQDIAAHRFSGLSLGRSLRDQDGLLFGLCFWWNFLRWISWDMASEHEDLKLVWADKYQSESMDFEQQIIWTVVFGMVYVSFLPQTVFTRCKSSQALFGLIFIQNYTKNLYKRIHKVNEGTFALLLGSFLLSCAIWRCRKLCPHQIHITEASKGIHCMGS